MKRISALLLLATGVIVGFLCGAALTAAHGDQVKNDYNQVVGQVGDSTITRGRLAEYVLATNGDRLLNTDLQDIAIAEEAARRAGVTVTQEEVNQRIAEMFKYAESAKVGNRMKNAPRPLLEEQIHSMMLAEKMMKMTVSDSEARLYFIRNQDQFSIPTLVRLICVATENEADARAALKALKGRGNPRDIAAHYSSVPQIQKVQGDMGWFAQNSMSPEIALDIFGSGGKDGLRAKQFTDIINHEDPETRKQQFLIFYVDERMEGKQPRFDEVVPAAQFYARTQKYKDEAPQWFDAQVRSGQLKWLRVKSLFEPLSPLTETPFNPERYHAQPMTGTQE